MFISRSVRHTNPMTRFMKPSDLSINTNDNYMEVMMEYQQQNNSTFK